MNTLPYLCSHSAIFIKAQEAFLLEYGHDTHVHIRYISLSFTPPNTNETGHPNAGNSLLNPIQSNKCTCESNLMLHIESEALQASTFCRH